MGYSILINGSLRDSEELSLILQFVVSEIARHPESRITKVVVSTWKEEAIANPKFISWAQSMGITFKLSDSVNYGGPANYVRQMLTLDAGLDDFPADEIVFKTRTDKALLRKDAIRAFISASSSDELLATLANRLAIEHISTTVPFMAKDMILMGRTSSIRELVSFSERTRHIAEYIYWGMGPEVFLWLEYARNLPGITAKLRNQDLRETSTQLCRDLADDQFENALRKNAILRELFSEWIKVFDQRFLFISETLGVRAIQPWLVDEGSWRYQIGDRPDLEKMRQAVRSQACEKNQSLSTSAQDIFTLQSHNPFTSLPDTQIFEILESLEQSNSDIILIRRKIIFSFLQGHPNAADENSFAQALSKNLRHRDPEIIESVIEWMQTRSPNLRHVSNADKIFALERAIERASLQGDFTKREALIGIARDQKLSSSILTLQAAEVNYSNRRPIRALVSFIRAYRLDPNSLGPNHGLGCVLLDLRLARLAEKYLSEAHRISPQDQTAAWTLFRCSIRLGRLTNSKYLIQAISTARRSEAQKMFEKRFAKHVQ